MDQRHSSGGAAAALGLLGVVVVAVGAPAGGGRPAQTPRPGPPVDRPVYKETIPVDHPALRVRETRPDNVVAEFGAQLRRGVVTLEVDERFGYLPSLLDRLDVNPDSQVLVFSKTSLLREEISPRAPRAIYFNDEVAVGHLPGAEFLELAAVDTAAGAAFYRLDLRPVATPRVARATCLRCHHGPATQGVPGFYVGSVFPSRSGRPNFGLGTVVTDHRTPFDERWGGWYVDGGESLTHRGNAVAREPAAPRLLQPVGRGRRGGRPGGHLSNVSDIVALMTLEHQTQMTNLLTRLNWEARIAAADADAPDVMQALDPLVGETVAYLLFADEAPFPAPVAGRSTFATTFPARGPHDRQGRSLRDFDLTTRLFRYPLSYMIYSRAFDRLPDPVRETLYRRLYDALTDRTADGPARYLDAGTRTAIRDIVADTKADRPEFWR